jgi:hypothetical protein
MKGRLSAGSAAAAYQGGKARARGRAPGGSSWKIVLLRLATAISLLIAQLVLDAPVIQTRVGAAYEPPALMYGGIRG